MLAAGDASSRARSPTQATEAALRVLSAAATARSLPSQPVSSPPKLRRVEKAQRKVKAKQD